MKIAVIRLLPKNYEYNVCSMRQILPFYEAQVKKKKKSNVSMYEKDNIKSIPLAWFKTTIS